MYERIAEQTCIRTMMHKRIRTAELKGIRTIMSERIVEHTRNKQ